MDQNRHKVKRQRSNKRPKSPPKGTNEICTTNTCHMNGGALSSAQLHPSVGCDSRGPWRVLGQLRDAARVARLGGRRTYVHVSGWAMSEGRALRLLF